MPFGIFHEQRIENVKLDRRSIRFHLVEYDAGYDRLREPGGISLSHIRPWVIDDISRLFGEHAHEPTPWRAYQVNKAGRFASPESEADRNALAAIADRLNAEQAARVGSAYGGYCVTTRWAERPDKETVAQLKPGEHRPYGFNFVRSFLVERAAAWRRDAFIRVQSFGRSQRAAPQHGFSRVIGKTPRQPWDRIGFYNWTLNNVARELNRQWDNERSFVPAAVIKAASAMQERMMLDDTFWPMLESLRPKDESFNGGDTRAAVAFVLGA